MLSSKLRSIVADPRGDQIFTANGSFTVPARVTSISVAIVPGTSTSTISSGGVITLTAGCSYTSPNYTSNASYGIPAGVASISVTAKGGDAYQTSTPYGVWALVSQSDFNWSVSPANLYTSDSMPFTAYPTVYAYPNGGGSSIALYPHHGAAHNYAVYYTAAGDWWCQFNYNTGYNYTNNAGSATTVSVSGGSTWTYSGASSGNATPRTDSISLSVSDSSNTLNLTIGYANGYASFSYLQYAYKHTSFLSGGSTYNLTGNIVTPGPYSGNIAAWRNSFAVTPGQVFNVTVASGGAVRVMWGNNRSFPSNAL